MTSSPDEQEKRRKQKSSRKKERLILIIIFGVTIASLSIIVITQQMEVTNLKLTDQLAHSTIQNEGNLAIGLQTDDLTYSRGQRVNINGTVSNASGPINVKVAIQVFHLDSNSSVPLYQSSVFANNGTYYDNGLNANLMGTYKVSAVAFSNDNNIQGQAYTFFEVLNPLTSWPAFFMYGAIVAFVALMILIRIDIKKSSYEVSIVHFLFLSTIAVLPIISLAFTDFETGAGSAFGLVVEPRVENGEVQSGGEWVLNIGGNQADYYRQGIQIPVYVIIFGLAGGYIRYLYKNSHLQITKNELHKIKESVLEKYKNASLDDLKREHIGLAKSIKDYQAQNEELSEGSEEDTKTAALHVLVIRERRKFIFHQSLKDVTLFLLSPLLAIALWFFLLQGVEGGTVEPYLIAIISFSVGLVTEQVIEALKQFASNIIVKGSREETPVKQEEKVDQSKS